MLIIVTCLRIVRLIVDDAHHIRRREPPAVVLVIPYRPHLAIIEKSYRFLAHNIYNTLNFEYLFKIFWFNLDAFSGENC